MRKVLLTLRASHAQEDTTAQMNQLNLLQHAHQANTIALEQEQVLQIVYHALQVTIVQSQLLILFLAEMVHTVQKNHIKLKIVHKELIAHR